MRICLSSREIVWGGGEAFLSSLGREFKRRGCQIVWRIEPTSELAKRNTGDRIVPRNRAVQYDLLVANDFRSVWQSLLIDGVRKRVFIGHGPWQFSASRVAILKSLKVQTYVVSRSVAATAVGLGMTREPAILPLGPDGGLRLRNQPYCGLPPNAAEVVFGSVARLDPIKRLPVFARVTAKLGARGIVVVPSPVTAEEIQIHNELSRFDNIEVRTEGNVDLLWEDIDVFMSTSYSESLGLAHLEALQNGRPVLSTAKNGPGDFLTGSLKVGWLPEMNESDLSLVIPQRLAAIGAAEKDYWGEAQRILSLRGISRCADLILENQ